MPVVLAVMDPKIEWTEAGGWLPYIGTSVGPQAIVDGVFMRRGEIGDNISVNMSLSWSPRATPWWAWATTRGAAGLRRGRRSKDCPRVDARRREGPRFQQHGDTAEERCQIA